MEASVLQKGQATFSLDLHPAYSSNPLEGIKLLLDPRLLRWDNDLDGILLAFKNIQRLPTQAVIRPYFPYIHLKIRADVLVFRPQVGAVVCGNATKMGADFIGMTILGTLNAAIGRQNIRPELSYSHQRGVWYSVEDPAATIEVGSVVTFMVKGVQVEKSGLCAIVGSLTESWSGTCQAAAIKQPAAFSQLQRWQAAGAVADALPGLNHEAAAPKKSKGLTSDPELPQGSAQPALRATPAGANPAPANAQRPESKLERSTKKTKRKAAQMEGSAAPVVQKPPSTTALADAGSTEIVTKAKKKQRTSSSTNADTQPQSSTKDPSIPISLTKNAKKEKRVKTMAGDLGATLQPNETKKNAQGEGKQPESLEKGQKKKKKKKKKLREELCKGLPNGTGLESQPNAHSKSKRQDKSKEGGPAAVKGGVNSLPNGGSSSKQKSKVVQGDIPDGGKASKKPKDKHRKSQSIG